MPPIALLVAAFAPGSLGASEPVRPNLVVQITVDQLRGDFLPRFRDRLGTHGIRYFMERGVDFRDARYDYATTFTAVGHATLFTGAHPAQHGIVGNFWIDRETGVEVYCVEDPVHGKSGRNLLCNTIGDELVLADPRSRVFSVSLKDRGAILPAGHLGKAFWYDSESGEFRSSPAYYPKSLPAWAVAWNEADRALEYAGREWGLLRNPFTYLALARDDRPEERPPAAFGRTFPHLLPEEPSELFATLPFTPFGDRLLLDFVRELVVQEGLGRGKATDFLAISFSASDYVGHAFGPGSLEAEDNFLRLDDTVGRLLLFLEETLGLDRCLLVLSSDHGVDVIPEVRHHLSCAELEGDPSWTPRPGEPAGGFLQHVDTTTPCCAAGRHHPKRWLDEVNDRLAKRWNLAEGPRPLSGFWNPAVYLNETWFSKQTLERSVVERIVAAELRQIPGIALVVERHRLLEGDLPRTPRMEMIRRSFHPDRSGDWILVQEPGWFLNPVPEKYAAMHGSPYTYDTHVPVLFAGRGIAPRVVWRRVAPHQIAPTVAALLGIEAPSASLGEVLPEALPGSTLPPQREPLEASWSHR